jgi:hypothetical protein
LASLSRASRPASLFFRACDFFVLETRLPRLFATLCALAATLALRGVSEHVRIAKANNVVTTARKSPRAKVGAGELNFFTSISSNENSVGDSLERE